MDGRIWSCILYNVNGSFPNLILNFVKCEPCTQACTACFRSMRAGSLISWFIMMSDVWLHVLAVYKSAVCGWIGSEIQTGIIKTIGYNQVGKFVQYAYITINEISGSFLQISSTKQFSGVSRGQNRYSSNFDLSFTLQVYLHTGMWFKFKFKCFLFNTWHSRPSRCE